MVNSTEKLQAAREVMCKVGGHLKKGRCRAMQCTLLRFVKSRRESTHFHVVLAVVTSVTFLGHLVNFLLFEEIIRDILENFLDD